MWAVTEMVIPFCYCTAHDVLIDVLSAWVQGAADPTSGTVSLHEIVRAFGALTKQGWKPLRNVIIASWDAEEVRRFLRWETAY